MTVFFHHMPKCAGNYIKLALESNSVKTVKLSHRLTDKVNPGPDKVLITACRHPIDRFLSTVNFYVGGGINPSEKMIGEIIKYKWKGDINDFITKEDLTGYIIPIGWNHQGAATHFMPMKTLLGPNLVENFDHVVRYETLAEDILKIIPGATLPREKPNTSDHIYNISDLTEGGKNRLLEIYKDDFKIFKY